ncbi:MAG: methyltransferase domain-containing protein [Gammaproteobacteria bacterium]
MSSQDRDKWNKRYKDGWYQSRGHASEYLIKRLTKYRYRHALDLGCGLGRNINFLKDICDQVTGIDISNVAIQKNIEATSDLDKIHWRCLDLCNLSEIDFKEYDLIVIVRFMNNKLIQKLPALCKPETEFIIEQHLETDLKVAGPTSRSHRMKKNEIRELLDSCVFLDFFEGIDTDPDGKTVSLVKCHVKNIRE